MKGCLTNQSSIHAIALVAYLVVRAGHADFIEVVNDRAGWETALSDQESIFFTEFPPGFVTDQYSDLGILFTNGDDFITTVSSSKDGFGLSGFLGPILVAFDRPRTAIAADFPGGVQFRLFYQGDMVFNSSGYGAPVGESLFVGILADEPFDAAWILDPGGGIEIIDNLFFGDVIPAPGVMALFGVAGISMRWRRRK